MTNKMDRVMAALKKNPKWETRPLTEHIGCEKKLIARARSLLGIRNPDAQGREWTEIQDNCLLYLRDVEEKSFRQIGLDMGIPNSTVRNRYTQIQGKTPAERGYKHKAKMDFIWPPGPVVRYVPVFGR